MRSAHVAVVTLTGTATEIIKNIVLAGVGRLTVIDDDQVVEEDLGAGFFFREDDVGSSRTSEAPLARIQELNPLVKVSGAPRASLDDMKSLAADVLIASGSRTELIKLNEICRAHGTKFYATSEIGAGGYVFSDLGAYDYVVERTVPGKDTSVMRMHQDFVPLADSLSVKWTESSAVPRFSPGLWGLWALWEYLADGPKSDLKLDTYTADLEKTALRLLSEKGVSERLVFGRRSVERGPYFVCVLLLTSELANATIAIARGEHAGGFSPVAAVLGGIVAQDILNALGHREEPIVNWCILDAARGTAQVHSVGPGAPTTA